MDKLKNKFIIIVPVYNAKDLIEDCIISILSQSYDDLGIIIRDDISTDGTDEVIKKMLGITEDKKYINFLGKDIIFIRNSEKLYPVGNTYDSVLNYVDNDNAIIGVVDGDDKLLVSNAISKISKIYDEKDKWMVWSQHKKSTGGNGESKPLPPDEIIYSGRNYWSASHFRTNKAFLFKKLNKNDLLDPFIENSYYTYAGDAAFLFPLCEMCGNEKTYFLNESLYLYNCHLPTNEHNKGLNNAIKYGSYIRNNGVKYSKLNDLL
jgi:glycosyltransferase involved in cell wall biosynthesis